MKQQLKWHRSSIHWYSQKNIQMKYLKNQSNGIELFQLPPTKDLLVLLKEYLNQLW